VAEDQAIELAAQAWRDEAPGIRAKEAHADGSRFAVVEYGPGASRGEWCTDGHRGFVLDGAIEYEFEDGGEPLRLRAGQAFVLGAGRGHRGRNVAGAATRLFLIDDPS
jgi:quercetin dioxygenase-like cupin family protein